VSFPPSFHFVGAGLIPYGFSDRQDVDPRRRGVNRLPLPHVILSTATPPSGAYSSYERGALLVERALWGRASSLPVSVVVEPLADPRECGSFILSQKVRRPSRRTPRGCADRSSSPWADQRFFVVRASRLHRTPPRRRDVGATKALDSPIFKRIDDPAPIDNPTAFSKIERVRAPHHPGGAVVPWARRAVGSAGHDKNSFLESPVDSTVAAVGDRSRLRREPRMRCLRFFESLWLRWCDESICVYLRYLRSLRATVRCFASFAPSRFNPAMVR